MTADPHKQVELARSVAALLDLDCQVDSIDVLDALASAGVMLAPDPWGEAFAAYMEEIDNTVKSR